MSSAGIRRHEPVSIQRWTNSLATSARDPVDCSWCSGYVGHPQPLVYRCRLRKSLVASGWNVCLARGSMGEPSQGHVLAFLPRISASSDGAHHYMCDWSFCGLRILSRRIYRLVGPQRVHSGDRQCLGQEFREAPTHAALDTIAQRCDLLGPCLYQPAPCGFD